MRSVARFVAQNPKKLFFGYVALSTWPFFALRTEFNAPFSFTLKYLAVPILLFCWWTGLRYRDEFMAVCGQKSAFWAGLVAFPFLAVLWSAGFVMQANAFLPPQTEVWIEGEIAAKSVTGGRTKGWTIDVRSPDGLKRIEVSAQEYATLSVGEDFHQKWRHGPLGFSYVWR